MLCSTSGAPRSLRYRLLQSRGAGTKPLRGVHRRSEQATRSNSAGWGAGAESPLPAPTWPAGWCSMKGRCAQARNSNRPRRARRARSEPRPRHKTSRTVQLGWSTRSSPLDRSQPGRCDIPANCRVPSVSGEQFIARRKRLVEESAVRSRRRVTRRAEVNASAIPHPHRMGTLGPQGTATGWSSASSCSTPAA